MGIGERTQLVRPQDSSLGSLRLLLRMVLAALLCSRATSRPTARPSRACLPCNARETRQTLFCSLSVHHPGKHRRGLFSSATYVAAPMGGRAPRPRG